MALQTAVAAISGFVMKQEIDVYLIVFDKEAYSLSENLLADVKSYIDEHYVEAVRASEYERGDDRRSIFDRRRQEVERASSRVMEDTCMLMETQYEPSAAMAGNRQQEIHL